MPEDKPQGFTITDRRSFTTEGQAREEGAPRATAAASPEAATPAARELPPVDFATFVLSLGSSALLHLGDAEHPQSGKVDRDLPMAKHTIDLLSMLQAKTKGNLSAQEEQLLEGVLFDLRLRFVEASKR